MYDIFEQEQAAITIEQTLKEATTGDTLAFKMLRPIPWSSKGAASKKTRYKEGKGYIARKQSDGTFSVEQEPLFGGPTFDLLSIEEFVQIISRGEQFCDSVDCSESVFVDGMNNGLGSLSDILKRGFLRKQPTTDDTVPEPEQAPEAEEEEWADPTAGLKKIHEYGLEEMVNLGFDSNSAEVLEDAEARYHHLYENFFNRGAPRPRSAQENFSFIRVVCAINTPSSDIDLGESQEQWAAIKDAQDRIAKMAPRVVNKVNNFTKGMEGIWDDYGIPLPSIEVGFDAEEGEEKSDVRFREIKILKEVRSEQYKKYTLTQIFEDQNVGAGEIIASLVDTEESPEGIADEPEEETPEEEYAPVQPLDPEENEFRVGIGEQCNGPCTPALKIRWKDNDGVPGPDSNRGELFYGENDPLNNRAPDKYDINEFIQKHFGISFVEYWKMCKEDITKDVIVRKADGTIKKGKVKSGGLEAGDVLISAPNFWPIHVALALEEFDRDGDTGGEDGEPDFEMVLFHDTAEELEKFNQAKRKIQSIGIKIAYQAALVPPAVKKVLSKRMAYGGFSDDGGSAPTYANKRFENAIGLIEVAAKNPNFAISDNAKELIDRAISYYDGSSEEGRASSFWKNVSGEVVGPSGSKVYFNYKGVRAMGGKPRAQDLVSISSKPEKNLTAVPLTPESWGDKDKTGKTYVYDGPSFVFTIEGEEVELSLGRVYVLPKGSWRGREPEEVDAFSKAERVFFKRIGLKADTNYDTNLDLGKTNFGGYVKYDNTGEISYEGDEIDTGGLRNMGPAPEAKVKSLLKQIRGFYMTEQGELLYNINPDDIPDEGESPYTLRLAGTDRALPVTIQSLQGEEGLLNDANGRRDILIDDFKGDYPVEAGPYVSIMEPELENIKKFEDQIKPRFTGDEDWGDEETDDPESEEQPEVDVPVEDPTLEVTRELRKLAYRELKDERDVAYADYKKEYEKENYDQKTLDSLSDAVDQIDYEIKRIKEIMTGGDLEATAPTKNWEDITQEERREILKILGISVPGEEEEEEVTELPDMYMPEIKGPLVGRLSAKRDTDKYIGEHGSQEMLSEAGYEDIPAFYQALDECYGEDRYIVLDDSEMDRAFGEKHREAFDKLLATKEAGTCGEELENPENKLDLERFEGFDNVRPTNSKRAFAHPEMIKYLEKLTQVGDGEWRIGDISLKGGGSMDLHKSHQTGLDVDVGIPLTGGAKHTILTKAELESLNMDLGKSSRRGWDYIDATPETIDYDKTLDALISFMDARAWMVFLDIVLIKAIAEYIRDNKEEVEKKDKRLLRYSADSNKFKDEGTDGRAGFGPRLEHEPHHMDHFHVRLKYKGRQYATAAELLGKESEEPEPESVQESKGLSVKDILKLIGEVLKES